MSQRQSSKHHPFSELIWFNDVNTGRGWSVTLGIADFNLEKQM
ncbi:MAG: hypothetical protein ACXABV_14175 [Candidatus Thorarchaeota archaeon]